MVEARSLDYHRVEPEESDFPAQHFFEWNMLYACHLVLSSDDFQLLQMMRPRIGTEVRLVLTPSASVFLEHAVVGGDSPITPYREEILDLMRAEFAIPLL